jgi:carotenoid cleavage dioxygenase
MNGKPPFGWEPELGSYVGVLARSADIGAIRWFNTDPCHVFHPMNAWEEGSKIIADVMQYPSAPLVSNTDGSPGNPASAKLVRWTFDLADNTNNIKQTPLDHLAAEFPRFDERRASLSYRHGYFAADTLDTGKAVFNGIAHFAAKTGKRIVHELRRATCPVNRYSCRAGRMR